MPLSPDDLRAALLTPPEAAEMDTHGSTDAAVLVPIFGHGGRPGLVFTRRRSDLRRHAGEVSFPGGRPDDPEEGLIECALRESQEEIGLDPAAVEMVGALPPTSTVVTAYRIFPFVGLIPAGLSFAPNPEEVESVLELHLDELVAGYGKRRLIRRGIPIRTDSYVVGDELIWGATARILKDLLDRLAPLLA